jgi:hypothetical protein
MTEKVDCSDYCCVCHSKTLHRLVLDDEIFDVGLECMVCHTVWEASFEAVEVVEIEEVKEPLDS